MKPDAYVFDAYGTLFDVHAAVRRHATAIGVDSARLSDIWRQKQLEYTWVRSLMGRHRDFAALTEEALDFALAHVAPSKTALKSGLLAAYRELDAYPEARSVLAGLKKRGARLAILSNGTPEMLDAMVRAAGLGEAFDAIVSVEEVSIFKTAPQVYRRVVDRLGVPAESISFQSSNRWDIAGAVAFGMHAVWINRSGQPDEYRELAPHAVVSDLNALLTL
jgi:2-haloacid dehalogenase